MDFSIPTHAWLFFYSKSGVKHFFEAVGSESGQYEWKICCYGPKTAEYCKEYHRVDYIGEVDAQRTARELAEMIPDEKILFVCGKNSLRSVQKHMPRNAYEELIVYDHYPKTDVQLDHYNVALLTSPMNARAFFDNNASADHIICIGKSTANEVSKKHNDFSIAEEPSERGLNNALVRYLAN